MKKPIDITPWLERAIYITMIILLVIALKTKAYMERQIIYVDQIGLTMQEIVTINATHCITGRITQRVFYNMTQIIHTSAGDLTWEID